MRTFVFLLLYICTDFVIVQLPEAIEKNVQAVNTVHDHMSSTDSIKKAISFLDEAIAIDPSDNLAYGNKA